MEIKLQRFITNEYTRCGMGNSPEFPNRFLWEYMYIHYTELFNLAKPHDITHSKMK